ncbi:MAG: efflux RND transporter permease subunit [Treponemataceae bacterium]|nr:MAG: efflux RND transporter permease subunit [Treponemataceae bacterium]
MSLPKLAVSKPATILIIAAILLALGLYSTLKLPIDLLPEMEIPYIAVSTSYSGAGPEEVERTVTRTLESSLSSVSGLDKLSSTSSTGSSTIIMQFIYGTNLDEAGNEMRDRIDMVKGYLPDDAGTPTMFKMDPSMMPIMAMNLRGNRTPEELRAYAEDIIQPRLEQVDGVASVSISGGRDKAIRVDIPRDRLEAYSLTITQIVQMLAAQNIESSGGTIKEGDLNYSITTSGQYKSVDDIRNTVISYKAVQSTPTSAPVMQSIRLRDIADVYEGYKSESTLAYMNGEPCVRLTVSKQSGKNSVQTSDRIQKQIGLPKEPSGFAQFISKITGKPIVQQKTGIMAVLPNDVELVVTFDTSDMIRLSINNVTSSLMQGIVLAIIILFVFLRSGKSTLIIAISIPLSVLVTMTLMYFCGFTLNLMTLAGLTLGVGMLVDNSVVILENIYSYREKGTKLEAAAVLGSEEMAMAITASTLTTICVFVPLIMMQSQLGMIGQFFSGLTFTVVFSLVCSLVSAIVLVPVLAAHYLKLTNIRTSTKTASSAVAETQNRTRFSKANSTLAVFFENLDNAYANKVRWVVNNKKKTVFFIFLLLVASLVLAVVGVGFEFMPASASNEVTVNLAMPKGTKLEVTEDSIRQMESIARQELKGVVSTTVSVGGGGGMSSLFGGASSNTASLDITLTEFADRTGELKDADSDESAKAKLRKYFGIFPGANFSFGSSGMSMGGGSGGIDVVIKSDDLDLARKTADSIVDLLKTKGKDFVHEPTSSLEDGLPQVRIDVDRDRLYSMGLTVAGVGNEIRANISGLTASRYQDSGKEIDIVVALDEKDKASIDSLDQIFVNSSTGQRVPLSNFASSTETTSPVSISRENQTRVVHVTATPEKGMSIGVVQKNVERLIAANIVADEAVNISYGGDNAELMEGIQNFVVIILMAVILVFAVMASQFESFKSPFIVLFCIPLSIVGIIMVYFIMRTKLNLITAVGLLILVGVIVNNGIVLVDYTNLLRKRGLALKDACVEAARNRLRPILMTTLTTVLGLVPMAFFPGEGSEMTQPIGQTVFGGLTFGTVMTLFLMPALYCIFNQKDESRRIRKLEADRVSGAGK